MICHLLTHLCTEVFWGGTHSDDTGWGDMPDQEERMTQRKLGGGESGLPGVFKTATVLTTSLSLLEANAFHWVWPLLIVKSGPLRICKPNTTLLRKWLGRPFKRVMMKSCNAVWVLSPWQWGPHPEWDCFFFYMPFSHYHWVLQKPCLVSFSSVPLGFFIINPLASRWSYWAQHHINSGCCCPYAT